MAFEVAAEATESMMLKPQICLGRPFLLGTGREIFESLETQPTFAPFNSFFCGTNCPGTIGNLKVP